MGNPGIMIAAVKSGSGKTTITCAFLKQLKERGKHPVSFKCGPDYIDPMFHETVLKIPSKNLDTFFSEASSIEALYEMEQPGHDISVLEGVMGLYDGLGGIREEGSSYHLAKTLEIPVVLVIDAHGMGRSIIPLIAGFLKYDEKKLIKGVILNRTSKMFFDTIAPLIEKELSIRALGCIPNERELSLQSRHLGLLLPEETEELDIQLEKAGKLLEKYVDVDAMIEIAEQAARKNCPACESVKTTEDKISYWKDAAYGKKTFKDSEKVRIAVAKDEAFCFYYRDNLNMLEHYGAELVPFSPLHDKELPADIHGMLLGGGYPELYAAGLSANMQMKDAVKHALENGMPSLAECGGFMYLHETLTDKDGCRYKMAGVIPAECHYMGKLVRFGYVEVTDQKIKEHIKAHEFHYFDSTDNGADCIATKPVTGKSWPCIHAFNGSYWGFPHFYYPSDQKFVQRFVDSCIDYKKAKF